MVDMKWFSGLSRTGRVMIMWVIALGFAFMAAGLLVINLLHPFEGALPYAAGLILGCAHSAIKIVLLEKSLARVLDLDKKGAESTGRLHFFGRYLLTAAFFAIVVLSKGAVGIFGAIAGVLSQQFAAYITGSLLKNRRIH